MIYLPLPWRDLILCRQWNGLCAAEQNYDDAVVNYQACLTANPSNPNACEGQRHIMDADAQVLSG